MNYAKETQKHTAIPTVLSNGENAGVGRDSQGAPQPFTCHTRSDSVSDSRYGCNSKFSTLSSEMNFEPVRSMQASIAAIATMEVYRRRRSATASPNRLNTGFVVRRKHLRKQLSHLGIWRKFNGCLTSSSYASDKFVSINMGRYGSSSSSRQTGCNTGRLAAAFIS